MSEETEKERIQDDFMKAKEIYDKILETIGHSANIPPILFALSLIYVRQLKHHKYEEKKLKLKKGYGEP